MTVSSEQNKAVYNGDGATTEFGTQFRFASNDEVTVTLIDAAGVETEWTSGSEYVDGCGRGRCRHRDVASRHHAPPAASGRLFL